MIYFVQIKCPEMPAGPVKIGVTIGEPERRRSDLQVGCPWPIELLGTVPGTAVDEYLFHTDLHAFRMEGEWFRFDDEVRAFVDQKLSGPDAWKPEPRTPTPSGEIIDVLGGNIAVARLTGSSPQAVSNWRGNGRFPAKHYLIMATALARHGHQAIPALWRMRQPAVAAE